MSPKLRAYLNKENLDWRCSQIKFFIIDKENLIATK